MSQFPDDEFVKEYIPELIQEYGLAKSSENIMAQRREIDVHNQSLIVFLFLLDGFGFHFIHLFLN